MSLEASGEEEPCAAGAGCVFAGGVSAECEWGLYTVSDNLLERNRANKGRYQIYVSEARTIVGLMGVSMGKTERIRIRCRLFRRRLPVCLLHARCWKVRSSPPCSFPSRVLHRTQCPGHVDTEDTLRLQNLVPSVYAASILEINGAYPRTNLAASTNARYRSWRGRFECLAYCCAATLRASRVYGTYCNDTVCA